MTTVKRYFTVAEANQTLPLVRSIVQDIVDLFRDLRGRHDRLQAVKQRNAGIRGSMPQEYSEELEEMEAELERDAERLQDYVQELQNLGVEIKDLGKGLVDFPHQLEGREVYLCWMLGERDIQFWHELDAGFQGRQTLLQITTPDNTSHPNQAEAN